jgi:hypothetical protein
MRPVVIVEFGSTMKASDFLEAIADQPGNGIETCFQ